MCCCVSLVSTFAIGYWFKAASSARLGFGGAVLLPDHRFPWWRSCALLWALWARRSFEPGPSLFPHPVCCCCIYDEAYSCRSFRFAALFNDTTKAGSNTGDPWVEWPHSNRRRLHTPFYNFAKTAWAFEISSFGIKAVMVVRHCSGRRMEHHSFSRAPAVSLISIGVSIPASRDPYIWWRAFCFAVAYYCYNIVRRWNQAIEAAQRAQQKAKQSVKAYSSCWPAVLTNIAADLSGRHPRRRIQLYHPPDALTSIPAAGNKLL